jgi:hypothetical protein
MISMSLRSKGGKGEAGVGFLMASTRVSVAAMMRSRGVVKGSGTWWGNHSIVSVVRSARVGMLQQRWQR